MWQRCDVGRPRGQIGGEGAHATKAMAHDSRGVRLGGQGIRYPAREGVEIRVQWGRPWGAGYQWPSDLGFGGVQA